MATLDTSVTNTALPAIAQDLGATPADVIWVVTAYQLTMVAAMLPVASLGEVIGHRRIFLGGLFIFALASLACGIAPDLPTLVAARALQGLGAANIMSGNTALIRAIYPESKLGRGLGLNALVVAAGLAGGPVVASAMLLCTTWHWIFLINLPLCAMALGLGWRSIPTIAPADRRFDIAGALLCATAFGLLIHGLGEAAHDGSVLQVAIETLLAMVCAAALLQWQRGRPAPILPIDLFMRSEFSLSAATALFAFVAQGIALVALPFVFLQELGHTQVATGLLITPWPVLGASMAPIAGRLSDRLPSALLSTVGLVILALSIAGVTLLAAPHNQPTTASLMAICGFGFGLFLSPNQRAIMMSAPAGRSGSASGILGTARLLGQTLGASAVALVLSQSMSPSSALWLGVAAAGAGALCSAWRHCTGRAT